MRVRVPPSASQNANQTLKNSATGKPRAVPVYASERPISSKIVLRAKRGAAARAVVTSVTAQIFHLMFAVALARLARCSALRRRGRCAGARGLAAGVSDAAIRPIEVFPRTRRGVTGRWDFCSTCSRRWRALLSPLFQPIVSDCTHLVSIMVEIQVKISAAETPTEV